LDKAYNSDCSKVEKSDFTNFIRPPANMMAVVVIDSLNYNLDNARGRTTLQALLISLTAAGINVTSHQVEARLTTDGPDGAGAISMGSASSTFTNTRKVVYSLASPLPFLITTTDTLKRVTIHMMPDPINPWFPQIYRVPKPATEEGEIPPPKPDPDPLNPQHLPTPPVADSNKHKRLDLSPGGKCQRWDIFDCLNRSF
jgi:hypothetical protein